MNKDKSLFVEFFGDYPLIRVLDFLMENDIFDYSKKDICRKANISWNTLETFWMNLEELGILKETRKVGKSKMYQLNKRNIVVKQLIELDKKLMKKSMEKIGLNKQKIEALA